MPGFEDWIWVYIEPSWPPSDLYIFLQLGPSALPFNFYKGPSHLSFFSFFFFFFILFFIFYFYLFVAVWIVTIFLSFSPFSLSWQCEYKLYFLHIVTKKEKKKKKKRKMARSPRNVASVPRWSRCVCVCVYIYNKNVSTHPPIFKERNGLYMSHRLESSTFRGTRGGVTREPSWPPSSSGARIIRRPSSFRSAQRSYRGSWWSVWGKSGKCQEDPLVVWLCRGPQ